MILAVLTFESGPKLYKQQQTLLRFVVSTQFRKQIKIFLKKVIKSQNALDVMKNKKELLWEKVPWCWIELWKCWLVWKWKVVIVLRHFVVVSNKKKLVGSFFLVLMKEKANKKGWWWFVSLFWENWDRNCCVVFD